MTQVSKPNVTLNVTGAVTLQQNEAQKVLIRGQQDSAGTYTAGELVRNPSKADIKAKAGARSMLFDMYNAVQETLKGVSEVDLVVEADPTGTAAQGKIAFSGTATAAGDLVFTVGSERNGQFTVSVAIGDDGDAIAAKANTAADALLESCWTADVGTTTSELEIDASNDGTEGNFIPIKGSGSVAGVTYTITAFTGGTGTVATRDLDTLTAGIRYQTVVQPGTYLAADVTTNMLEDRWNVDNKVLDGVAITNVVDTAANIVTNLSSLNEKTHWYLCDKAESRDEYKGPSQLEYPWGVPCMVAGARSRRLTQDASITDLVDATSGPLDGFGGPALASLPYFNTPLPIPVQPQGWGYTDAEVTSINNAGGSVIGRNDAGSATIIGEAFTTYLTNAAGDPDVSFKFVNYVDTISNVREYQFNNLKASCRQSRLTEGSLIPNRKMNNQGSIRGKLISYFETLSGPDYVLIQSGEDARVYYLNNLQITLDLANGKVTIAEIVPLVTQLRQILGTIAFSFSVNG